MWDKINEIFSGFCEPLIFFSGLLDIYIGLKDARARAAR